MPLYPATASTGVFLPADAGLISWSSDSYEIQGGVIMPTAGLLHLARLKVPASTITNILVHLTVGGTLTPSQCFAALFTSGGTLLSTTADQAAAWTSGGLKTMALTVPQTVGAGSVYAGWFANGSPLPTFSRAVNSASVVTNLVLATPNLRSATADAGLTTAMPATFGAQTGSITGWWVGLS